MGLTAGAPFAIAIGAGLLVAAAGQPWRTLDTVAVIVGGLVVLVPSLLALS